MAGNRSLTPKITWSAAYINTLVFNLWLDTSVSYSDPVEGARIITNHDGDQTYSRILGHEQYLSGLVRRIPRIDTVTGSRTITGWMGATGWEAFLTYARDLQPFRYYYDEDGVEFFDAELVEPMTDPPTIENDSTRRVKLVLRNITRAVITGY